MRILQTQLFAFPLNEAIVALHVISAVCNAWFWRELKYRVGLGEEEGDRAHPLHPFLGNTML